MMEPTTSEKVAMSSLFKQATQEVGLLAVRLYPAARSIDLI
jgi:hypothetical protein